MLSLLENQNLLEHETFTELLWAVFHMGEELSHRDDVTQLNKNDYNHISGDIKRVYHYLFLEWLDYMLHLKKHYPYMLKVNTYTRRRTE